jgi:hypothetical protein
MQLSRPTRAAASLAAVAALSLLAACSDTTDQDSRPSATPTSSGGVSDLASVCPGTIVVQAQWLPTTTSEGALYGLLGPQPDIDAGKKRVTAPLVAHGKDTGVKLELRAGGPAIGYTQTSAQMYADKSITLGVAAGFDEIIQLSAKQPTLAVLSMLEKDPQMIMWDPETYPEFRSIRDIGETNTKVLYFEGDTYMEYLVGAGILKRSQLDGSGDGSPSRFVASGGKIAQSGYAAEDPYTYEEEVKQWGKPVKFQLVHDAGYPNYGPPLVIRAADKAELTPCLRKLVPIVQQAQVDFLAKPKPVIELTAEISEAYKGGDIFTKAVGEYGATQLKSLGLASNDAEGKDQTVGNFDDTRVQKMIDLTKPIFTAQKKPVKDGLKPADVVTNAFIDPKIGYDGGS